MLVLAFLCFFFFLIILVVCCNTEQRMVDTAGQLLIRYLLFGIVHLFILDKSTGH